MVGTSIRFAPLSSWPRRINHSYGLIARESGRPLAKSFTLWHRPCLIKRRRTAWTKTQLGARSCALPICGQRRVMGSRQPGSVIGINPGTRSGTKLYSQKNRTAVFDQTRPMAEREAFGERASQTSSNSFPGAVINDTTRTRGNEVERCPDHRSCDSPFPRQFSLVTFFFARKRK